MQYVPHPNRTHYGAQKQPVLVLSLPNGTTLHGYATLRKLRPGPVSAGPPPAELPGAAVQLPYEANHEVKPRLEAGLS